MRKTARAGIPLSHHAIILLVQIAACLSFVHATSFTSVKNGAWSDPQTWGTMALPSRRQLPGAGDNVFVASGTMVVFDLELAASPLLQSVSVQSRAIFTCPRNADLQSTTVQLGMSVATLRIESGGCFSCGHGNCTGDAEPFAGKFTVRLNSPTPPASASEDVRTFMVQSGGSLFLSGAPRVKSIARLAADAESGQTALRIADPDVAVSGPPHQSWRAGDRVAVGPTDLIPSQTEYATILGIEAGAGGGETTLIISDPLKYARNGRTLSLVNTVDDNRRVIVDTRAEIALLSRNVVIEGTNDAMTGLGGDLMMAGDDVRAQLSWVELRYLGRRGHLARYPLHIHNLGESGRNVRVSNTAIHSSFQRGVVIHCTDGVTLINNTVAGSPGFAYMLEDGAEENNTLIGNYAIDVRPADYPLIQTERVNSAGFWFVNAANTFVGNVAAGVFGAGFSLDMDPVLGSRPSSLTTCPERLPGYDAKLARENTAEFNRAVNTALINKNFVRFDDNVVHSAHSGLWMSYPFTPMFFVERPVPIVRFTAWNIAARQMPASSLDSTDGVSLQFDGCIRLQGQRGMHIYQPTCVNPYAMATWASCVNTFEGTTLAWVDGEALTRGGAPSSAPPKSNGVMFTHLEPQIFLRTQILLGSSNVQPGIPPAPLFVSLSKGGPLAALNTLAGTAVDDDSANMSVVDTPRPPLIRLNAGDMHVFTDVIGDAFGAGAGAVVAATYANATGIDPLIEAYAPGRCRTGEYASNRRWPHVSSSVLPNGRIVAVHAGMPMLCAPGPSALRFTAINVDLRAAKWAKVPGPFAVDATKGASPVGQTVALRRVNDFPAMVPLTEEAMHPVLGGYSLHLSPGTWDSAPSVEVMELSLASTLRESDGMTLAITGLPMWFKVSTQQSATELVAQDGTLSTCHQIATACVVSKRGSSRSRRPLACMCIARDVMGAMTVRLQAGTTPRYVGLSTNAGRDVGVYDFPAVRINVAR